MNEKQKLIKEHNEAMRQVVLRAQILVELAQDTVITDEILANNLIKLEQALIILGEKSQSMFK